MAILIYVCRRRHEVQLRTRSYAYKLECSGSFFIAGALMATFIFL